MLKTNTSLPKDGDIIFSENGTEFYDTITAIKVQRVTSYLLRWA